MTAALWFRWLLPGLFALTLLPTTSLAQQMQTGRNERAIQSIDKRFDTFACVPDDPKGRFVYGTNRGRLYVIEKRDRGYAQVWSSPSLVTRVREVQVADLKRDGRYAIVAYNARGYLYVYDLEDYNLIWQTPEMQFNSIEALAIAQVDRDKQLELVFLSEGILYIYDGRHFVEEWRSDAIYEAADIAVGDIDDDGDPDIVLGSGHIIDALSRTLEWVSSVEFGDHLELADIDGDGKLELVAGSDGATTIWDLDERHEKWE